jgi:hypothetical protein
VNFHQRHDRGMNDDVHAFNHPLYSHSLGRLIFPSHA